MNTVLYLTAFYTVDQDVTGLDSEGLHFVTVFLMPSNKGKDQSLITRQGMSTMLSLPLP